MPEKKLPKKVSYVIIALFSVVCITAVYIMKNGLGLIEGMDWGPGAYYYTDIPGWEKIFLSGEHITFNTTHPLLFVALFIAWGGLMWKVWQWLDKKL